MTWWVLTLLYNSRAWTTLYTLAWTNRDAHLFMAWANYKPSRKHVYRNVRGKQVFCGYQYVWDTPNLTEQSESGDTYTHTFILGRLEPPDHVWYYLFSLAPDLSRQCQGPLIHIEPPEFPMPSARVYNTVAQSIPDASTTALLFNTAWWDDANFWDPDNPSNLNIPFDGLYDVGASFRFATVAGGAARAQIQRGIAWPFVTHSHDIGALGWDGAGFCLHTLIRLRKGDAIQIATFQVSGAAKDIMIAPSDSPHFWIRLVGPYPD